MLWFIEKSRYSYRFCVISESEAMVKVDHYKRHLRFNEGPEEPVYHDVHHPLCYCEEFQQKVYTSE